MYIALDRQPQLHSGGVHAPKTSSSEVILDAILGLEHHKENNSVKWKN